MKLKQDGSRKRTARPMRPLRKSLTAKERAVRESKIEGRAARKLTEPKVPSTQSGYWSWEQLRARGIKRKGDK